MKNFRGKDGGNRLGSSGRPKVGLYGIEGVNRSVRWKRIKGMFNHCVGHIHVQSSTL